MPSVPKMDEEERRLWHMIDVGDYGGVGMALLAHLRWIQDGLEGEPIDISEEAQSLKGIYNILQDRFKEIALEQLDHRFPVEELKTFKESVMPQLGETIENLCVLVEYKDFFSDGLLLRFIKECRSAVNQMTVPRDAFVKSERYNAYRKTNPQRNYLMRKKYSTAV